jgi:integrase
MGGGFVDRNAVRVRWWRSIRIVVTAPRRDGEGGMQLPLTRVTDVARHARRACRHAGIAEVKFHELRDTYASHLAERVSLPIIGAVLGHADPNTTARYADLDTEGLARDKRLHLSFSVPEAEVIDLPKTESEAECTQAAHGRRVHTSKRR